jgi:hypothetical protein
MRLHGGGNARQARLYATCSTNPRSTISAATTAQAVDKEVALSTRPPFSHRG